MTNIIAIETSYRGFRFRSRTEARWAVFFDTLGVRFEYEKEGFRLPSGPYLPDFWLPQVCRGSWFEVKGLSPTAHERALARELAELTARSVFIAGGAPDQSQANISYFADQSYENSSPGCAIVDERDGVGDAHLIGPEIGGFEWCKCQPGSVAKAFIAAKSARFEHGQSGAIAVPASAGDPYGKVQRKASKNWHWIQRT